MNPNPGQLEDGASKPVDSNKRSKSLRSLRKWRDKIHSRIGTPDTLPQFAVGNLGPSHEALNSFAARLETARDERPMQTLFEKNRNILTSLLSGGHGRWCSPKPSLTGEFEPDFIIGERSSVGYEWYPVELESPRARPLTKDGVVAAKLNNALKQVRQWRAWAGKSAGWLEKKGYLDIDGDFAGYFIVIGRREGWTEQMRDIYRQLSRDEVRVLSYDRLLEIACEESGFRKREKILFEQLSSASRGTTPVPPGPNAR